MMAHSSCQLRWQLTVAFLVAFHLSLVSAKLDYTSIWNSAHQSESWIIQRRRDLHKTPELGFDLNSTHAYILEQLQALGIPYKAPIAFSGIVATIGSGPLHVALRADMDALPVLEPEGLEYRSQRTGRMHACGHDGHMSMLLGAAKILKERESELPGAVDLIFQPNEEFGAGGAYIVEEGALDQAQAVFGMHVMPHIPSGVMATRAGPIMAGALSFHVTVKGQGGHAALPHLNVDPIVAAASIISALQTLVSRETSPLGSSVISVTILRAGEAYNVIPSTAEFGGTLRALDHNLIVKLQKRIEELSASVAAGFGCSVHVDWREGEQPYYPPLVNDDNTQQFAKQVASQLLGTDNVVEAEPIMAGEDFAFYCRKVDCAFLFMGIRNETVGSVHNLHSPNFVLDESILAKGAALHASLALEWLEANKHRVNDGVSNMQSADPVLAETVASTQTGGHEEL